MRSLVRAFGALLCAVLPLSCGGSGGGGGGAPYVFTAALLSGNYHMVALSGGIGPPEIGVTIWGSMTANGVNLLTPGAATENENRVISAVTPSFPYVFTLSSSGELSLTFIGTEIARGGLAREGLAAAIGNVFLTSDRSTALLLLRKGSGLSASALLGPYHLGYLGLDGLTPSHVGVVGTATFDGAGAGSLSPAKINSDGTLLLGVLPAGISYVVAADGAVTTTGAFTFAGGVLTGGDVAILGGSTVGGVIPYGCILVRQSGAASAASLSGTFTLVGLAFNVGSSAYEAITGTLTADGAGNYGFEATVQSAGMLSTIGPTTGTYAVAANGKITLDAGFILEGAVSPGGAFAFLGGATSVGSNPGLYFLVRR